jgi:hypothetical protein
MMRQAQTKVLLLLLVRESAQLAFVWQAVVRRSLHLQNKSTSWA